MGKSRPRAPDPMATAQQQAEINRQAAYDSARLNQLNQMGPWGGVNWSGEIGSPDRTQQTYLHPGDQQRVDLQRALSNALFGAAGNYLSGGPGGGKGAQGGTPPPAAAPGASWLAPPAWMTDQPWMGQQQGPAAAAAPVAAAPAEAAAEVRPPPRPDSGFVPGIDENPAPTVSYDSLGDFARAMTSAVQGAFGRDQGPDLGGGVADWGGHAPGHDYGGFAGTGEYRMGGYTGAGQNRMIEPSRPAGTVHEGEFVFSAPAVNRIGLPALRGMHDKAKMGRMPMGDPRKRLAAAMVGP